MANAYEQDIVTVRGIPATPLAATAWLVLAAVLAATAAWEWRMRDLGLLAGDLDDSKAHWAVERRRIAAGEHDGIVIVGGSRILFDTDLDAWQAMTGRRPVQLAMPGMRGQPVLRDLALNSEYSGLVLIDVTPEQFFREGPGNPEFEGVLDYWKEQGPAARFGHRIGLVLSRHLAFLDDQYSLRSLVDQLDIPNRSGVRGPYLRPWKLSESVAGRHTWLWREIERNQRLREHAMRVWLAGDPVPPGDELVGRISAEVRDSVSRIRARGGEVVFIRPPSTGAYYEREQRNAPRGRTWDRLLREAGVSGIHFEDHAAMQGLELPEMSHLSRESATRFTRAYVALLVQDLPWLRDHRASRTGG